MSRDKIFLYVLGGLFTFMLLFSMGIVILSIVRDPSDAVSLRSISAVTGMFSACIGLVLGYLVGRNGHNGGA